MIGQRFGRLIVIAQAPTLRYTRWVCACDCGERIVVSRQLLSMGAKGTRSCGCLRREQQSANMRRIRMMHHASRPATSDGGRLLAEVWR